MIYTGSLVVLVLSFLLFRLAAGNLSLTRPHLISIVFYKDFILWTFIGVVLIASSFDLNNGLYFWGTTGHVHEQARFNGWLSTMYTMLAFPFGMLLSNIVILRKLSAKKLLDIYYSKPFSLQFSNKESAVFITLVLFLILCLSAILYTFYSVNSFPLFHVLKGADPTTLAQMRANAKIHFNGIAAIKDVLAINLTFLMSLICYGYKLIFKNLRFNILFYISFLFAVISLTYNLEKAPVFWYFISLFFVRIVYMKGVGLKRIIIFTAPLLLGVFFVFSFFTGAGDLMESFVFRIFVAQSVAIFQGFEYFPSQHEFLGVNGISRLYSFIAGGDLVNSGRTLFELYAPAAIENNTAGFIVGLFNAEAWMLFGLPGVLILPVYVGFFVQALNVYFLKSKKTPFYVALYVYFWSKLALAGSVAQFLYPVMLIAIFILFFGIIILSKIFIMNKRALKTGC